MNEAKTEVYVVKASQFDGLLSRIHKLRNPNAQKEYEAALAEYKAAKGNRREVERKGEYGKKETGFYVLKDGKPAFTERPTIRQPRGWGRLPYDRSFGTTTHATSYGLLADGRLNREIREQRVEEYVDEMRAGRWRDLLSDPITITADSQVVNGQHRLAAAEYVDWNEVENDPAFLIILGVSASEALYADGSRRTARDEKTIATKLLAAQGE